MKNHYFSKCNYYLNKQRIIECYYNYPTNNNYWFNIYNKDYRKIFNAINGYDLLSNKIYDSKTNDFEKYKIFIINLVDDLNKHIVFL